MACDQKAGSGELIPDIYYYLRPYNKKQADPAKIESVQEKIKNSIKLII